MKKFPCLFCALFLAVFLFACSGNNVDAPSSEVSTVAETPTNAIGIPSEIIESDNPLLCADFLTDTVLSGSGKNIGTYGYIAVEKSSLPDFYSEEFSKYFTEFANTRVHDSGYNWVSIIFDDGTGFCFTGSNTIVAEYGSVDNEGNITTQIGLCIASSSGKFEYEENQTRSIPNPTVMQEALAPNNSFEPAPSEVFSTTAEENGFGDMAFYAEGTVVSRFDASGYDTMQVTTAEGDLYISAALIDLPEISEGDSITVFFIYAGWSDSIGGACGTYVYSE